jgi:ribonuclease D
MFDLRFMAYRWKVIPANVVCTRISAKLLDPTNAYRHSLQSVLKQYLNVTIDKDEQRSDWSAGNLSEAQIAYAANDSAYLIDLFRELETRMSAQNLLQLAQSCFAFIPTRIQLDIRGYGDLFHYSK